MKLKLSLARGDRSVDITLTADAETRVGEVAEALLRMDPDRPPSSRPTSVEQTLCLVDAGGQVLDHTLNLADSGVRSGARIEIVTASLDQTQHRELATATVRVTSGPDAGKTFPISAGTTVIGRGDDSDIQLSDSFVSRHHVKLVIDEGNAEATDLGSANGTQLNDDYINRAFWRPNERLKVGDTILALENLGHASQSDGTGGHSFNRSPMLDPTYRGPQLISPTLPEQRRKQRIPMIPAMVTPLFMGIIMFVVARTSKSQGLSIASFAFIGMSPVMMITSALDSRWSSTRGWKNAKSTFHTELEELNEKAASANATEIAGRNAEHPSSDQCTAAARELSPLLWSRRPSAPRFLEVKVGSATQPTRSVFEPATNLNPDPDAKRELSEAIARYESADRVPAAASLTAGPLGIAGFDHATTDLARSVLLQVATLHSPAEVVIAGFLDAKGAGEWDWLKWLPHTSSPQSPIIGRHLVCGTEGVSLLTELERLIEARTASRSANLPVVVVLIDDAAGYERPRLVWIAESGRACGVHVIWLARQLSSLPAACEAFVDVRSGEPMFTVNSITAERIALTSIETIDVAAAADVARTLSPIVDAGAIIDDDSDLPRTVSWLELHGADLASKPEAVIERWVANRSIMTGPNATPPEHRTPGTLRALVGQGAGESHALDLRVHGPHVLLGGTTGAGKSELLQSWIMGLAASHSPQRVTFLLVDYKGGSAFSDCTRLPHTVGLVTDLTQHLVRRALTSLAAELTYRERLLASKRAKDLLTLEASGDPETPPSLVIVVDEFAALIKEVPDFVDGVVNVAQRGRSLGLHLILATQRPAGVIRDNLRANTNLRVALRMADEADSTDVVGSPLAAGFDLSLPGRAMSKTGPGRLVPFQAAYIGGHTGTERTSTTISVEELAIGLGREWAPFDLPGTADTSANGGPRDITRVVETVRRASEACAIPAPRRPWLAELSTLYDLAKLPTRRRDDELVFGVVDHPENQAQATVAFQPDRDGNLAIFGTSGAGKSTLLRTIGVAAGLTIRGGPCRVYCLDFGARGLRMLEDLPHVGAVVNGDEREALTRVFRTLQAELQDRAQRFSMAKVSTITDYRRIADQPDEARILLLIDGFAAFRQQYENVDSGRLMESLATIMSDGRPLGIHVVLTADRATTLPGRLASSVQRRVVMRLADDNEYVSFGARGILDGDSPPGRAVMDGDELQVAVFGGRSESLEQSFALQRLAQSMRQADTPEAAPIRTLDANIPLSSLPIDVGGLPVIGIADDDLAPVGVALSGTFSIAGQSGSGRSTACATILGALARTAPDLIAYRFGRAGGGRASVAWRGEATNPEAAQQLAQEIREQLVSGSLQGKRIAVLVEDLGDFAGSAADTAMVDMVRQALRDPRFVAVSAGTVTEYTRTLSQLVQTLRGEHSGFVLQPEQSDGYPLFKVNFPRCSRDQFPVGRGFLVFGSTIRLVQLAQPD
jgi:S-DNA-T family DNA segregation ATPase FtsK/SpoIIIE